MNKSIKDRRKTILSFRTLRENVHKKTEEASPDRLKALFDDGKYEELFPEMETRDPISFPGYAEKIAKLQASSGLKEALVAGRGTVLGYPVIALEMKKEFLMGSMGAAVGEKIALCAELAGKRDAALVIFVLSGGARMQEGMFALMQMAKTSRAVMRFRDEGGLYISVLTDPTTGGVSASFASLGSVILAEPGALIGFAGPRVIEQTIREELPEGFQKAEFQLEHGFVDKVVHKEEMRDVIGNILRIHSSGKRYDPAGALTYRYEGTDPDGQVSGNREKDKSRITAYEKVMLIRDSQRPKIKDYTDRLFTDFTELCGDRLGGEDRSVMGGIGFFDDIPVTVIGHRKGENLEDNVKFNFGMSRPEGFRKAMRLMKEAERFSRPVITFIDTPGAYPGMDSEENGISMAIAENLAFMGTLKVPVIAVVTGEGSSGGALAIGVADRILMLENAVYSVLSPEGFASILWKDASKAAEASEVMRMTAEELVRDGIADGIIEEPEGGIQKDIGAGIENIRKALRAALDELMSESAEELLEKRYLKYRNIK